MENNLEKDIENAIRARGLREQMQQWEAEARTPRLVEQTTRSRWSRIRKYVYPIAIAAMLCGVIWKVVPASVWRDGYRMVQREYARRFAPKPTYQNSSEVLLALANPDISEIGSRNANSHALGHEDPIMEAVTAMQAGHYRTAQSILDDVQSTTAETNPRYQEIMDDVDYLFALCDLGRGRRIKAYRQLKAIAQSDSRHAHQAAELIKHFK